MPKATKRCYLLLRHQKNHHSHFVSPKGATGQVHTLSALRLKYFPQSIPPWCAQVSEAIKTKYFAQGHKTLALAGLKLTV